MEKIVATYVAVLAFIDQLIRILVHCSLEFFYAANCKTAACVEGMLHDELRSYGWDMQQVF